MGRFDGYNSRRSNDAQGTHIGAGVVRLVAARLAAIEGGGTSYRYGGEEFWVLFSDRTLEQALPHLWQLLQDNEDYRMAGRGGDRPREKGTGSRLRATRAPEKTLSVTVSIGAAERDDTLIRPALVIRAADEALYRAKRAGRNRVMRYPGCNGSTMPARMRQSARPRQKANDRTVPT